MSDSKLYVIARVIASIDRIEETRELMVSLLEPTRRENGCIRYDLFQNRENPAEFTFIEEWQDQASLDAHLASPHIRDAIAKLPSLFVSGPVITLYDPVS
ncbi:putative quinol monooxygenase [Pannus brasiliensis CCIBt3594]|uniref:Quinol monooxygenase n=1 Tax=Pannus brasiliensis CCIBt3594 TaxID=1427578 RepID=A0AAW9QP80_9CHRO